MIEHVYRRAEAAQSVSQVIVATDDLRIATRVHDFGGRVRLTRLTHQSGTDRLAEVVAVARLRHRRQRAGRRAADRSARDRRSGRAARRRSVGADDHAVSAHHERLRAQQPEHHESRRRPRRVRAVFFPRADSPRPRPARRLAAPLSTYRPLRVPPQHAAGAGVPRADAARAGRIARATAGAGARHSHQGGGNRIRLASASTRRRTWNRCAGCWRRRPRAESTERPSESRTLRRNEGQR